MRMLSGRDGAVRYRTTVAQISGPFLVLGLAAIGLGLFSGDPIWHALMWRMLALTFATCAWMVFLTRVLPAAITLTQDRVVVARGWRRRVIPWPLIVRVTVESGLPGIRHVVLTTISGKRISLSAPTSFLDNHFTEKAEAIRAYWIAGHQLPAFEPPLR